MANGDLAVDPHVRLTGKHLTLSLWERVARAG